MRIKPLKIPLELSPDYIPIDKREDKPLSNSIKHDVSHLIKEEITYPLPRSEWRNNYHTNLSIVEQAKIVSGKGHFFHSMKAQPDNSAFKYIEKLGKGSLVRGYDKFQKELEKAKVTMFKILDEIDSHEGMASEYNSYIGSTYNFIANQKFYFKKAGVKTYTALMTVKKLERTYKKFKKEAWSKR